MLVGPIIAPLIGGAISDRFGWKATFVLLAVLAFPIALLSIAIIPESHHYYALQNIKSKEPNNISRYTNISNKSSVPSIKEAANIELRPLLLPWNLLSLIFDATLFPYYFAAGIHFACMFTSLTTLPIVLAQHPYNLSPSIIGVTFLPVGFSMLLGAQVGGASSDRAAARFDWSPDGRMVYAQIGYLGLTLGTTAFGLCLDYRTNLVALLLMQCILGFGQASTMPATMGYLSTVHQSQAASAGAVMMFLCFAGASVSISVSVFVGEAIGYGKYFYILGGLACISFLVALYSLHSRVFSKNVIRCNDALDAVEIDLES
jgi:MFS family permease